MAQSTPIFDLAEALHRTMGDVDFLKMMVDEFHNTIPDHVTRIKSALEAGDLETMGKEAHQFKGAAANMGAKALAEAALALERIGKSGVAEGGEAALMQLDLDVNNFFQCLEETDWSSVKSQSSAIHP